MTDPSDRRDPLKEAAQGRMEVMRTFGQLGTLGLSFVIAMVLGVLAGTWLDKVTGWKPFFFILFFILGFAAGVLNVYRTISRIK
jgi:F0F1-type ATP synthase assembly protein I